MMVPGGNGGERGREPPAAPPLPSVSRGPRRHIPVLLSEVIGALNPRDGETFIDATFGAGGYARAILEAASTRVIALDRDPTAIAGAKEVQSAFGDRLTLVEAEFSALEDVLARVPVGQRTPAGVVMDLGVSSMQLDEAARGFSFQADGPLDMRMSGTGPSAADIVNEGDEALIADILYILGEERRARAIARAIVDERARSPLQTTGALAQLVGRIVRASPVDKHPATRTFQALRLYVNDELGELHRGLIAAERVLAPGGRLVVVSFHSLEDRIVKRFLTRRTGREASGSRHLPVELQSRPESFRLINQRPLTPGEEEVRANPRARSARLRAAVRTGAPPWPAEAPSALGLPTIRGDEQRRRS